MHTNKVIDKTISLYAAEGWKKWFAKVRFWDAPLVEVESLLPKSGVILDLGCGEGITANYIALSSPLRQVLGIDVDKKRIRQAFKGIRNTKFFRADITRAEIPKADVILLVHVLHHLRSKKQQVDLLGKCVRSIKQNGLLLFVEVEPKFSLKYFVTWFTDHFLVPWLFEKRFYSPIFFRRSSEWKDLLSKLGFDCKAISAEEGKPFTHVILECRRIN